MRQSEVITWYSRQDVAAELVRVGKDREMAHMFHQGGYGKRPGTLQFPADVKSLSRQGASSFHMSEERWKNPMNLSTEITEREIRDLRKTWDLIIDIDCPIFEYSSIAAETVVEALKFHGVTNPSIKFSGNRGWHIGVIAEAFPEKIGKREFKDLFPAGAVTLISYVQQFIKDELHDRILAFEGDVKNIAKRTSKNNILKEGRIDVYSLLELDIQVGSVRHLIRAPYSLHEKSWLVSLPVEASEIKGFKKEYAKPENVKEIKPIFFNPELVKKNEAHQLLVQALDWGEKEGDKTDKTNQVYKEIEDRIPEKYFSPCMVHLLKGGMLDGRKRALFALLNFLRMMNWSWDEIEEKVRKWNSTNSPPLKEGYIITQIKWNRRQHKKFPPPNCGDFYYNIDVPIGTCKNHNNPVSYAVRQIKRR